MPKPTHTPPDEGLELIARYELAVIEARMERLPAGLDPTALARERADVAALASRIASQMRTDYLARTQP